MLRKLKFGLYLFFVGAFMGISSAHAQPWEKQVKANLAKAVKKSGLPTRHLGMYVSVQGQQGRVKLLDLNGSKKFVPASLTKIVTAAASLNKMPNGHRFVTALKSAASVKNGELLGNLHFVGGGDPGFVAENLWYLVNEFVRSGIQVIKGDIIVDDSRFDSVRFDPGRDPSRVDRAYDAPIGALSFNWNSVNVFVRPGAPGEKCTVFADPQSEFVQVENRTTTEGGSKKSLNISRVENGVKNRIIVRGKLGVQVPEVVKYKSITNPDLWSGAQLLSFLRRRGIEVAGKVKRGKTAENAKVLADIESKAISESVKDMLKFSNNFVAEMLTKNMAVESGQSPGTMKVGIKVIENFLLSEGFSGKNFHLSSPSGLSQVNRFRPMDMDNLLVGLSQKFTTFPEFLTALPIGGVDGTLKSRMNGTASEGWVRAKTGLLSGVVGLAGYVGRPDGRVVSFTFMFNGSARKEIRARAFFDRMTEILAR